MKTVILAGGFGTRLAEYTGVIPKPMVTIGGKPILWHIMNHYARFGHKEFILALGYKGELIKHYFQNYFVTNTDFTVDLKSGETSSHSGEHLDWKVTLVDTGQNTMTGGRLARVRPYLQREPFLLTYGDCLSDININKLIEFHQKHTKMVTVSGVRPDTRFGQLDLGSNNRVISFTEKPQLHQGWVNGGYFVMQNEFLDYIEGDETILEKYPLEQSARDGEMVSHKHHGFWQCMDTKRDHDTLKTMWDSGKPPWLAFDD